MLKDGVLVVEDDAPVGNVIREFLQSRNYDVIVATDCTNGEKLAHSSRPDAAILDYCLPDGNALTLIPRLKSGNPTIPLIVLTGFGSIELAVEAIKIGAENFLTKPTELSELAGTLQRCIENERSRQKQIAERSRRTHSKVPSRSPVLASSL